MWGQLRIKQVGHLKIRGDWEKFKYEGHTKFLGGFEKNRGGKAFRGPVTERYFIEIERSVFDTSKDIQITLIDWLGREIKTVTGIYYKS